MNAGSICGQAKGLGFSRDLDPVLNDSGGNNGGHALQFLLQLLVRRSSKRFRRSPRGRLLFRGKGLSASSLLQEL